MNDFKFDFMLPDVAEGLLDATVVAIYPKVGDEVSEHDIIMEIMTDKVTYQLPSPVDGIVFEIPVEEQDEVKVGTVLASFFPKSEFGAVRYTIYLAIRNLQSLDAKGLTNSTQPSLDRLLPLVSQLKEIAVRIKSSELKRIAKNKTIELQALFYRIWARISVVQRFNADESRTEKQRVELIRQLESELPELILEFEQFAETIARPRVFIGSSKSNEDWAQAIRANLGDDFRSKTWTEDTLYKNIVTLTAESVLQSTMNYDYAVFVVGDGAQNPAYPAEQQAREIMAFTIGAFVSNLSEKQVGIVRAKTSSVPPPLDALTVHKFDPNASRDDEMHEACLALRQIIRNQ